MNNLFEMRMKNLNSHNFSNITLSSKMLDNSNAVMDATFTNDPNYKYGVVYDRNMNPIIDPEVGDALIIDFKLQKFYSYTSNKDQVEYYIQFRPGFNPEKMFPAEDNIERYGFYVDISDEITGKPEKWLIIGKDDKVAFDRYNALKCNWHFEWLDADGNYQNCVGCIRDRNSYNSGEKYALSNRNIRFADSKKTGTLRRESDWKAICKNIVTGRA